MKWQSKEEAKSFGRGEKLTLESHLLDFDGM